LFSEDLGCKPRYLIVGGYKEYLVDNALVLKLKSLNKNEIEDFFLEGISIKDELGFERISVYAPIPYIIPGVHYVRWIGDKTIMESRTFLQLLSFPGFVVGYALSEEDDFLQNQEDPALYESRKNLLLKVKLKNDEFGRKVVDISNNPGRKRIVRNMILRSCWRMWFGDAYFELIPKDKLVSFKDARISRQLNSNIYFVELYDNPFEAGLAKNRLLQRNFFEHIDIESVYRKCLQESGLKF
jgi:hypothetical protein